MDELAYLNPFGDTRVLKNRLPHWDQEHSTYFVTFRLADSFPSSQIALWQEARANWLRQHPLPWSAAIEREYARLAANRIETALDQHYGSCILRGAKPRRIVETTLAHFDNLRHTNYAWVIMPNHVHILFSLLAGSQLNEVVHSWKSYSAKEINKIVGRRGSLWQKDYFDRSVRNDKHFVDCVRYIRNNPVKAKLKQSEYALFESDWVKSF